jgi:hypothetical protein
METSNLDAGAVRVFASIGSIDDIHVALRERFEALDLSRAAIDAAVGLADGHAAKLLAMPPIKRFGDLTLFPTLEAAGLRLALIEDPAAMERVKSHPKRVRSQVRQRVSMRMVEACRTTVLRELTSKAGKARLVKMTSAARRRVAKLAAAARWTKSKKSRKAA